MREAEVTRARRAGPAGCWGGARTRWLAPQVGEGGEARRGAARAASQAPGGLLCRAGRQGGRRGEMAAAGLLTGERGSCGSARPGCASPLTRCRRERPAWRRGAARGGSGVCRGGGVAVAC